MRYLNHRETDWERRTIDCDIPFIPPAEREEIDEFLRTLRTEPIPEPSFARIMAKARIRVPRTSSPRVERARLRESVCVCLTLACLTIALLWPCLASSHGFDRRPLSCPGGTFCR
jgi:hypothetical protein